MLRNGPPLGRPGFGGNSIRIDAGVQRGCKKRYRAGNVAFKECHRIAYGLADFDQAREMNDGHWFVVRYDLVKSLAITNVALLERTPLHKLPVPIDQSVKDDRCITPLGQVETGMRTDIACASNHQDVRH